MIKAIAPEPLKEGDRGNAPKASYRAKPFKRGCSPNRPALESRENPHPKGREGGQQHQKQGSKARSSFKYPPNKSITRANLIYYRAGQDQKETAWIR